jgi:hypothetical protein
MYDTFLYIQTHRAVGLEDSAFVHLSEHFPYFTMVSELAGPYDQQPIKPLGLLQFGNEQHVWHNGVVFRFWTVKPLGEIKGEFDEGLSRFKSWAIFQHGEGHKESSEDGLLGPLLWASQKSTGTQIFLINTDHSNKPIPIENVRNSLKCPSGPVMIFDNGAIVFASTVEPVTITLRRCADVLRKIDHWAIIDSSGETKSSLVSNDAWYSMHLEDLYFS